MLLALETPSGAGVVLSAQAIDPAVSTSAPAIAADLMPIIIRESFNALQNSDGCLGHHEGLLLRSRSDVVTCGELHRALKCLRHSVNRRELLLVRVLPPEFLGVENTENPH